MDHFPATSTGEFATTAFRRQKKRRAKRAPIAPCYVECRTCAFEPADQMLLPESPCPKCRSTSWLRLFRPGGLLIGTSDPRPTRRAKNRADVVDAQRIAQRIPQR